MLPFRKTVKMRLSEISSPDSRWRSSTQTAYADGGLGIYRYCACGDGLPEGSEELLVVHDHTQDVAIEEDSENTLV
jgi:hypothetical protein